MVTLAATACQPAPAIDIGIPDARPIAYDTIRRGSGVLGYAEGLLGPKIATKYQVIPGPGASEVEEAAVAGAWELPLGTKPDALTKTLGASGNLERVRSFRNGSLWIADYKPHGKPAVRLLFIDGTHYAFEDQAAPEARPGNHVYLIAYRLP